MTQKCFVCTGEIRKSTSTSRDCSSLLLCQILELTELENNVQKLDEIRYCQNCINRISNIGDMLEELERLEKKVLNEKYLIQLQLKENPKHDENQDCTDQLRVEIVSELRSTSIKSMLEKIRKRHVGRRVSRRKKPVLAAETVIIPINQTTAKRIVPNSASFAGYIAVTEARSRSSSSHQMPVPETPQERVLESHHLELESPARSETDHIAHNTNITDAMAIYYPILEQRDMKLERLSTDQPNLTDERLRRVVSEQEFFQSNNWIGTLPTSTSTTAVDTPIKQEGPDHFDEIGIEFPQIHPITTDPRNVVMNLAGATCPASFECYSHLESHERSYFRNGAGRGSNGKKSSNLIRNSPSLRPRKCVECGKMLSTLHTWRNHVLTVHRGQHKYKCTQCSFGCQLLSDMKNHVASHSDERHFKCLCCDSAFKSETALRRHYKRKICSLDGQPRPMNE